MSGRSISLPEIQSTTFSPSSTSTRVSFLGDSSGSASPLTMGLGRVPRSPDRGGEVSRIRTPHPVLHAGHPTPACHDRRTGASRSLALLRHTISLRGDPVAASSGRPANNPPSGSSGTHRSVNTCCFALPTCPRAVQNLTESTSRYSAFCSLRRFDHFAKFMIPK